MITPLIGKTNTLLTTTVRNRGLQTNPGLTQAPDADVSQTMVGAGTLQNWYITLLSAPGGGNTSTFTIVKNGLTTSMVVAITDPAVSGSDTTHTVSYVAGDTISVRHAGAGSAATSAMYGIEMVQTGQALLGGDPVNTLSTTATTYIAPQATQNLTSAPTQGWIIPTGGTISNLYYKLSTAPGGVATRVLTLVKNGTPTLLTTTATGAATTANDTTHSISVSPGDYIYFTDIPAGTPVATLSQVSCLFTPTIDGESIQMYNGLGSNASTTVTNYQGVGGGAWNATEVSRAALAPDAAVVKKLFVANASVPGAAKSYTYTLRSNATDLPVTAAISGAGTTTANDTSNTGTLVLGQPVSLKSVPSGTPTASAASFGFVTYIATGNSSSGFFGFAGM